MIEYGRLRQEVLLQPVSGKAVPVYQGEVLRIIQESGGTCVDFNCFNLHDYREHMSVGHMRTQGFRLTKGDYLISAPPRANLLMLILEMPDSCLTDLLGSRCSADLFEATFGFEHHTNCQDTLSECIREYGLTPDDTHDSFNIWMYSGWDDRGGWVIRRNLAKRGDSVDLLAAMDVLAVSAICGAGDISAVSNYFAKPIRLQVFGKSNASERIVKSRRKLFDCVHHRTVEDYKLKEIRTQRELASDPNYVPAFIKFPLKTRGVQVRLSEKDLRDLHRLKETGIGADDEDAIRTAVMEWYAENRVRPNPFWFKH